MIGMASCTFKNPVQRQSFEHSNWSIVGSPSTFKSSPAIFLSHECNLIPGLINALQKLTGPFLALTSLTDRLEADHFTILCFKCPSGCLNSKLAWDSPLPWCRGQKLGHWNPSYNDHQPPAKMRNDPQVRRSWTVRSMPLGEDRRPLPKRRTKVRGN